MDPKDLAALPILKVSIGWIELEATAEPTVRPGISGYQPVLPVRALKTGLDYVLYISAKSLTEAIEPLRKENNFRFTGLRFRIRKQSQDKFAPYEVAQSQ